MSEKHRVFVSKLFVLLAGLGAISIALLYIKTNTEGVLETGIYAVCDIFRRNSRSFPAGDIQ